MSDREREIREQFKKEADDVMFKKVEFDDRLKRNVMQKAGAAGQQERKSNRFTKKWAYGVSAAAIVAMLVVAVPWLQNDADPSPSAGPDISSPAPNPGDNPAGSDVGSAPADSNVNDGSSLSELKTVVVDTPEEAKQRFGEDLTVPTYVPEGYSLTEIVTTGMEEDKATQVIFNYQSGDKTLTVTVDRKEASLPFEFFEPIQVNGADGYIAAQPNMTELYWIADGIQFGIVGPISQEEAMQIAESLT